ncbi:hypothetical protein AVEN_69752-1 [Araneus ventricosus]|uniref:Uncharacterized protein n=1 Tax=Araneus ventricosus TaxID=182803 RepID=A0A4Y2CXF6_ARAVE|nr:hypothetical protein AVEN_69752-1 [Araneus ventricosus]
MGRKVSTNQAKFQVTVILVRRLTSNTTYLNFLKFQRGRLVILTSRFEATRGSFGTDLVIFNLGQITRTTPELAHPSPNFHAIPAGGRLTTTYDLACNGPHTRRIFSGIGSRGWSPPAPKPRPYH